ncbi:PAS domain S-box protein [Natrinema pallidum]|uniref:histidine kinase n=1 Tax=Natrinema pallidum DSM 3751 TaxID=1227495 RepID=L9YNQ8_9EURY|nr:PAS domain S-box protein [Natrinema pallidum]ELY74523.1 putative signal-transducing histidine kinase / response regulator [Natrinema pallidum DSM 3751]
MSRSRVLCVSADRSTRASLTLSLTDAPVDVIIAQRFVDAIDRLNHESIDAVVIDARTIANTAALVDAVESGTPTFVYQETDGDTGAVLARVTTPAADDESATRLSNTITEHIAAGTDAELPTEPEGDAGGSATADGTVAAERDLPDDLERLVSRVRSRLVDATSLLTVERVLREELTDGDRFAFVWLGEYDRRERAIIPWLSDPDATEWPLQQTFDIGTGDHPLLERVIRTRTLRTHQYDADTSGAVPFDDRAFERGVRSVAAIPLAANGDLYGVAVIYATERLSEHERDAVRAIAEAASHVLETIAVRGRLEQRERTLNRYERLVETAGDGMYVLDDAGHLMTVNDALVEMTGFSREGLLGEHVSILFDPEDIEAGKTIIRSLLASGESTDTLELSVETKAGATIPCEVQIAVLVPDGEFRGSVGVLRDVTERKRQERKLRERNERLDAFARIVSHDLRNPLGVAQGYLDLFEETGDSGYAAKTRNGLDRMESIIDDVLAIAREGEWAADTEPVDLESVAREAWGHVSTAEATLSVTETMTLSADRSRLLRLLENCFRNSIEHGETTETVRIGPLENDERPDAARGFVIEDDGEGLPAKLRDELFDPSASTSTEGLGIGLWIVREVATGHGWSVVATESESGGARLEFELDAQFSD